MLVSLDDQITYVYRNGILIGYSNVSTGKKGHRTPTGVFTVLQLDKNHHSSIYNNAPMPYTKRLTWGGISLHAGSLPGYPSSHGCIHLPSAFAAKLFSISELGLTIVIADDHTEPQRVDPPTFLLPVDPESGDTSPHKHLPIGKDMTWNPDIAPEGPLSILASLSDQEMIVFRNGREIGRGSISLQEFAGLG